MITALALAAVAVTQAPAKPAQEFGETFGHRPVSPGDGWPGGLLAVADRASVMYHSWRGSNEDFYFIGDTADVNAALVAFAEIDGRAEIVLMPNPGRTRSYDGRQVEYDWRLTPPSRVPLNAIWFPECARLTVHCDGHSVHLEDLELPEGVDVIGPDELLMRSRQTLVGGVEGMRVHAMESLAEIRFLPEAIQFAENMSGYEPHAMHRAASEVLGGLAPSKGLMLSGRERQEVPVSDRPHDGAQTADPDVQRRLARLRALLQGRHGVELAVSFNASQDLQGRVGSGHPRPSASIVNRSLAPVTVVLPGDGSRAAMRTPYIRWEVYSAGTGERVMPPAGWRCGNMNGLGRDEIVSLSPGRPVDLGPWLGGPSFPGPGRYRVILHYENDPQARRTGLAAPIDEEVEALLRDSTPLVLRSDPQEVEVR